MDITWQSVGAGLILTAVLAGLIRGVIWAGGRDDQAEVTDSGHPHESNRWSGRCYRCGAPVDLGHATMLQVGGKPPKHFCGGCAPSFAES